MTHDSALVVEHVSRRFGDVRALDDASFAATAGRVTALVGPNGCGKSTLMLILASLLAPDDGRVLVGGADPTSDPLAVRRQVGWMPDQFGTWDTLRVREVLQIVGAAYGMTRAAAEARTAELLALVRLDRLADQPARVLSRGQKQRLGLARALVHSPGILILDEPASGLDPVSRAELQRIVTGAAAAGTCVLISSHVLSELEAMADDVILMDAGRTIRHSSIADLEATWQTGADYRIRALDPRALDGALTAVGLAGAMRGEGAIVHLPDPSRAAALLADLVAHGAGITEFAPTAGRLERAYLAETAAHENGTEANPL